MPDSAVLSWSMAASFLLLLTRLGGALAFVPIPGAKNVPPAARIVMILGLSATLFPVRPLSALPVSAVEFALWQMNELLFGTAVGLIAGFVSEGLLLAAQVISTQAGYSFATTFDPSSQADSGVLQLAYLLASNLLFFSFGLDHAVLRTFATSLERWPAGSTFPGNATELVVTFSGTVLEVGLRLAVPIAGLLLLTDIFLALAGRLHAQLQLLSLAFPLKMLAALAGLAALAPVFASIYGSASNRALHALGQFMR